MFKLELLDGSIWSELEVVGAVCVVVHSKERTGVKSGIVRTSSKGWIGDKSGIVGDVGEDGGEAGMVGRSGCLEG